MLLLPPVCGPLPQASFCTVSPCRGYYLISSSFDCSLIGGGVGGTAGFNRIPGHLEHADRK